MAATFSHELVRAAGQILSLEARAKFNVRQPSSGGVGGRRGGRGQTGDQSASFLSSGQYTGLSFFAPNINLFTHALWGRGQETFGEDPFLAGLLGGAYVEGIQGGSSADAQGFLRAVACAKHFAGYNFD